MKKEFDRLKIGDKVFNSRLLVGTGKYRTSQDAINSIDNSDCEIITVAVRRLPPDLKNDTTNFLGKLDWNKLWLLPNTAGAQTAEEAIRMAFLGHELASRLNQPDNFFVKLEVISDPKYLLPDPIGTLKAAEFLVKKGSEEHTSELQSPDHLVCRLLLEKKKKKKNQQTKYYN